MLKLNSVFKPFITPSRYKVAYGGRGSGKSWAIAHLLIEIARRSNVRILCARELQNSIADSVIQLLGDMIEKLDYNNEFIVLKNKIIHKVTGSYFIFYGIKTNVTKVKSLEGIDICWVEEAENVSEESWDILIPTIRKTDSEIWISFNPKNILDPTYQRFVEDPPDDYIGLKVNWTENPHFPEELRKEKDALKAKDIDLYLHIWEGEPIGDTEEVVIRPKWVRACIDSHIKLGFEPTGKKRAGLDVADGGGDSNALCLSHGFLAYSLEEWLEGDTVQTAKRTWSKCMEEGIEELLYDSIGVGAGVKGKMNELNEHKTVKLPTTKFIAGAEPMQPYSEYAPGVKHIDYFKNLKAQAWGLTARRMRLTYEALEYGREVTEDEIISISSQMDKKLFRRLCAELTQPRVKYDENGKMMVEKKDDMKKRGIKSPNLAEAFVQNFTLHETRSIIW